MLTHLVLQKPQVIPLGQVVSFPEIDWSAEEDEAFLQLELLKSMEKPNE